MYHYTMENAKGIFFRGHLTKILDLGFHSLADTFLISDNHDYLETVYPLAVGLDPETGLFQNLFAIEPSERYDNLDYSYTSGNSEVSREHWIALAQLLSKIAPNSKPRILEIGSNDGFLLKHCAKFSQKILGVDASSLMVKRANQDGVDTILGVFGEDDELLSEISEREEEWDLIVANNVFNHANSPVLFLQACHKLLSDQGCLVIEVPYWCSVVENYRFDQIYHEHQSYFTVKSISALASICGFGILDVQMIDYHGGSLRILLRKNVNHAGVVMNLIDKEIAQGVFLAETYSNYSDKIQSIKRNIIASLLRAREHSDLIVGAGAAAKSNTFLTYCGLDKTFLDAITDFSPLKVGKFTPLTRIPIVPDDVLKNASQPTALILAWNIARILKPKLIKLNPRVRILEWS